jgi:hypothetical protein
MLFCVTLIAIFKLVGASHTGNVAQATIAISMQIKRDIARCHGKSQDLPVRATVLEVARLVDRKTYQ